MEKALPNMPEKEKKAAFKQFDNWLQKRISNSLLKKGKETEENIYVIPVIVHVIHNGEPIGEGNNIPAEQVLSQLQVLNEDYRRLNTDRINTPEVFANVAVDTRIEFRKAILDPEGNVLPEPGIHRYNSGQDFWNDSQLDSDIKPITSWDPKLYMNIWVANLGTTLLGYASWPKASGNLGVPLENDNDNQDGVVINNAVFGSNHTTLGTFDKLNDNRYDRGRTCSHEIGHYLALLHPWGVIGGCEDDDFCDDTPTTITDRDDVFSPCVFPDPANPNTCTEENDLPDMFQNFMDYTADACMNLFTADQSLRMQAVLENSPNRKELLSSQVIPPHFIPTGLVVNGNEDTGYTIQWDDENPNESGYVIARAVEPFGNYEVIGSVGENMTSFVDN
ncbi:MAG: zinc metalloprotease, partial [Bacteroidota bacterium]